MAQLPPKIPTIPQIFPSFHHQRASSMSNFIPSSTTTIITTTIDTVETTIDAAATTITPSTTSPHQQQNLPSWVDEFLDFSSSRRGAHRRSASDSIAFLETTFDMLDEEQLISIFSDDFTTVTVKQPQNSSMSNQSSPCSDQNSNNDEKPMAMALDVVNHEMKPKNEAAEEVSSCKIDAAAQPPSAATTGCTETVCDPKRVKRILANRQSAQRSRVRKLQYISELERSLTTLQTEVSALSPRVAFLDHHRLILNVDNSALKQRIAALAQDKIFKDAHQEALKKEIERLRQIYLHQQNLQKMGNSVNNNGHAPQSLQASQPQPQPQMQPHHSLHHHQPLACMDKEQLLS